MAAQTATDGKAYLVWPGEEGFSEENCRIVSATSADEARIKFVERVLAGDEDWLEQVYTNSAHARFAGQFFMKRGAPLFDEQGDWTCEPEEARSVFEANVRDYFGPHTGWAERYIEFYFGNQQRSWRDAMAEWCFPDEMIGYMLRRLGGGWCEVLVLPLDDILHVA